MQPLALDDADGLRGVVEREPDERAGDRVGRDGRVAALPAEHREGRAASPKATTASRSAAR